MKQLRDLMHIAQVQSVLALGTCTLNKNKTAKYILLM